MLKLRFKCCAKNCEFYRTSSTFYLELSPSHLILMTLMSMEINMANPVLTPLMQNPLLSPLMLLPLQLSEAQQPL